MWIVENQRGFRERKKMEKRKRKEVVCLHAWS